MMILTIKKGMEKKKLNEALSKIKYSKKFDAKRHLGKVKWGEDALDFQKRMRDARCNHRCDCYVSGPPFTDIRQSFP